jgi:putative intracellular protease/amidase
VKKNVLFIASNYGLWAEELQAPWDAVKKAGHNVTLATYTGLTPLPIKISVDTSLIDPVQNYNVNPPEVVSRVREILDTGEWAKPIKIADVKAEDYDAIVLVGGPGAPLDITGNYKIHDLLLNAFQQNKLIGAICYVVGALAMTRNPDNENRSIIYGKTVTAHPKEWDFTFDLSYELDGVTEDNQGTNLVSPGFVYALQPMIEDAVGPDGIVQSDPTTNRENTSVEFDWPFVTALSVESSIAFGKKLVSVLSEI